MSRRVVRNMGAEVTHLADLEGTLAAFFAGAAYRRPIPGTIALCGVAIKDGVVMREGSRVKCRACRFLAEGEEE